jgi:GH24 family phage-related lysozyme (muramidase)
MIKKFKDFILNESRISENELPGLISIDGHKVPFRNGISRSQAMRLLNQDRTKAAKAVDELVRVPLNIYQREALIDFVWHLGGSTLKASPLLRKLNRHS